MKSRKESDPPPKVELRPSHLEVRLHFSSEEVAKTMEIEEEEIPEFFTVGFNEEANCLSRGLFT
jgi:hypothetical protein